MMAIVKALNGAPCRNRLSALGWFLKRRLNIGHSEFSLRLYVHGREFVIPVQDIQTLVQGLKLFTKANPWERWLPTERPQSIVDLGANIGLASLYFAARFPKARIVAVEMMPENVASIRRLASVNRIEIEIAHTAVGASDGTATVEINQSHSRHRLQVIKADDSEGLGFTGGTATVAVSSLGHLFTKLGLPFVDLLKIDIEGAETLLMDDIEGWAESVRTVFLEVHHNVDVQKTEQVMTSHSFAKIGQDNLDRTEFWFSK